ncbi:MAG: YihY/virulence factor BrkB family protein [Opitutales bacterium]|jgi:membrane protein
MSDPAPTPNPGFLRQCRNLVYDDIWHHTALSEHTLRGRCYAFLRICSISVQGTFKNKIFVEAAALGYYSLISLGPLVSLAIIISSFFVQKNGDDLATQYLNRLILYIAPPVSELGRQEQQSYDEHAAENSAETPPETPAQANLTAQVAAPDGGALASSAASPTPSLLQSGGQPLLITPPAVDGRPAVGADNFNPALVSVLKKMINSAKSGKVGALGLAILVFICIQLIITIENTFNSIWGVRRGRSLSQRIVLYWAIISLGTLVGFTAGTLLSAATIAKKISKLPADFQFLKLYGIAPHLLSFLLVVGLLAVFYRFIPNTTVRWRPALLGGFITALLLTLNNFLSFLYVNKVISSASLFGSIGIFPVLMFGLYIFWLLILLGGQLTYAVQNANFVTDDRLWNQVSPRVRRLVGLAAFLGVARAFLRNEAEPSANDLIERLRVPGNILNESLTRLCDLRLLSPIDTLDEHGRQLVRYQPGRALDRLTLGEFLREWDNLGNCESEGILNSADPVIPVYVETIQRFEASADLQHTFNTLLVENEKIEPARPRVPLRSGVTSRPWPGA